MSVYCVLIVFYGLILFVWVPSGGISEVLVCKKRVLVYELEDYLNEEPLLPMGIQWTRATRGNVEDLFRDDPRRKKAFLRFIDKGYCGIILHHEAQWVNYGWMSKPDTLGPPHLPVDIQQNKVYWLFYQHTAQNYRGRGFYKLALQLQAAHALREMEPVRVLIDTRPDNIASRKGILAVGFQPKGIIDIRELRIPRVKSWAWGSWDVDADHPRLDGGSNS